VECSCEYGNEPSGSIKCWEVLGNFSRRAQLRKYLSMVRDVISVFSFAIKSTPHKQ
jgi:hypothetical protein